MHLPSSTSTSDAEPVEKINNSNFTIKATS